MDPTRSVRETTKRVCDGAEHVTIDDMGLKTTAARVVGVGVGVGVCVCVCVSISICFLSV